MKETQNLHEMGQSLWLENITRNLHTSGTLDHYIKKLSVKSLPVPQVIESMVELSGIEPLASSLRTRRSPN